MLNVLILQIDKNHINGVTTRGKIVMTPHGFINDDDKEIKAIKIDHAEAWSKILGGVILILLLKTEKYKIFHTSQKNPNNDIKKIT